MTSDELSYFYTEEGALRSFTDHKSLEDLLAVISLHKGKRDNVVKLFFNLWQESLQWLWFHESVVEGEVVEGAVAKPSLLSWDTWSKENYSVLRRSAYPSIGEQLALQYDDKVNGTNLWVEMQDAVKAQYPSA